MDIRARFLTILLVAGCALASLPVDAGSQSRPDFLANLKPSETARQPYSKVQGHAWFYLDERHDRLRYEIKINGLDIAGYDVPGKGHKDTVVAAQIRHGAVGVSGPVVLTFFGEMGQDDANLSIDSIVPTFSGVWDDNDGNEETGTRPLSAMMGPLCEGELYVAIQTENRPDGALRGQIHAQPGVCP